MHQTFKYIYIYIKHFKYFIKQHVNVTFVEIYFIIQCLKAYIFKNQIKQTSSIRIKLRYIGLLINVNKSFFIMLSALWTNIKYIHTPFLGLNLYVMGFVSLIF